MSLPSHLRTAVSMGSFLIGQLGNERHRGPFSSESPPLEQLSSYADVAVTGGAVEHGFRRDVWTEVAESY